MKLLLAAVTLLLSVAASAGPLEDKARKLFEIQGVVSNYQSMIDQSRMQAKEETRKTVEQMLTQLNPNKEFRDQIALAAEKYVNNLQTGRTAEDIVNVLIKNYAPSFTETELDKLIEFYSSGVGKKDAAVSKAVTQKVVEYYKADNEKIRSSATSEFVRDLQRIAQQCNCSKQTASQKK
jgi:hypothetical protein